MPVEALQNFRDMPVAFDRCEMGKFIKASFEAGQEPDLKNLEIKELERLKLEKIIQLLDHEYTQTLISQGNITLVLIRPHAEFNTKNFSDEEMVDILIKEFEQSSMDLEAIFSTSFPIDIQTVNDFWGEGPKQRMLEEPPVKYSEKFDNKWDEFVDMMISGPTTAVLFFSQSGDAPQKIRGLLGHWDPAQNTDQTIRGKYAMKDKYNNLIHGSDNPESVKNELSIVKRILQKVIK